MSRLRAKRSAWGSYANCWQISRSGYYAWLRGGESARKTANQAPAPGTGAPAREIPALGAGQPVPHAQARLSLFPGKGAPADEDRRHPLPAKEGLQSHHQLPPQLSPSRQTCSNASSLSAAPTKPGWATSPTSPPGKAGCISPLSKTCAPRKLWGMPFPSASTPSLPLDALNMAVRRERPAPGLIFHSDRGVQYARRGLPRASGFPGHPAEHVPQGRPLRQRCGGKTFSAA